MKNRKIIIIALAVLLLIAGAVVATDIPDKIVSLCKGFIYCNTAAHK